PFVGTPLDDFRGLTYTLWKTDFLSQEASVTLLSSTLHRTAPFKVIPSKLSTLARCTSSSIKSNTLSSTLWTRLSETDRDARLAEIKAHTTAIQREVIAHEATKKLANQPSAAHTYVVSAISTHLRRLYQATTCPYELFEHIKTRFEFNPMENNPTVVASYLRTHEFTDDGCIGTLPPLKKLMREWPAMVKAYVAAKKNVEDHEILTKAMKRAIAAK
ncbi:hypothetical protein DYB28_008716, partial [Aphanomyces astaci]